MRLRITQYLRRMPWSMGVRRIGDRRGIMGMEMLMEGSPEDLPGLIECKRLVGLFDEL